MNAAETMLVLVNDAKLIVTSHDWAEWQDAAAARLREAGFFVEAAILLDADSLADFRTACAEVAPMLFSRI